MSAAARAVILTLAARRGRGRTLCPSEAARTLDPADWRARMDEVRAAAAALQAEGRIRVTREGREVALAAARRPVRLGLPD